MKNSNNLKIKRELDTVYIDSSGGRHLNYTKALTAESQIAACRQRKLEEKQRIMDIVELLMHVLKNKNWGIFYKNKPMQALETNDGNSLYQVNQVDDDEIEKEITKALAWEKTSQQNKNSITG